MFTNVLGNVVVLGLIGFALGSWAARHESPGRRLLTGLVVGLVVFITPTVIGLTSRW